jgi:hypothetical protein
VFSNVFANSSSPYAFAVIYANGIYPFSASILTFSAAFAVRDAQLYLSIGSLMLFATTCIFYNFVMLPVVA